MNGGIETTLSGDGRISFLAPYRFLEPPAHAPLDRKRYLGANVMKGLASNTAGRHVEDNEYPEASDVHLGDSIKFGRIVLKEPQRLGMR